MKIIKIVIIIFFTLVIAGLANVFIGINYMVEVDVDISKGVIYQNFGLGRHYPTILFFRKEDKIYSSDFIEKHNPDKRSFIKSDGCYCLFGFRPLFDEKKWGQHYGKCVRLIYEISKFDNEVTKKYYDELVNNNRRPNELLLSIKTHYERYVGEFGVDIEPWGTDKH